MDTLNDQYPAHGCFCHCHGATLSLERSRVQELASEKLVAASGIQGQQVVLHKLKNIELHHDEVEEPRVEAIVQDELLLLRPEG